MATARNLVPRPVFRAGGPVSVYPWQAALGGSQLEALEDGLKFRQVDRNRPGVAIELPGSVWEERVSYRVTLSGRMDSTNLGYVGMLLPAASTRLSMCIAG